MYTTDRSVNLIEYLKLIWQRNVTNAYWYLYLYFGILLMLPLFQRLSVNMGKREYELLILVCAVFMGTMPIVIHYMPGAAFSSYFCDPFFSEFVGIFFLGYYIHNYVPVKKEYALVLAWMPYTIPVVLILGFWLPCTLALQIIYPALDKAFHLEKTITARRADEINDLMEQHGHTSV